MAQSVRPRAFRRQPRATPQIDWSNSITRGLAFCHVLGTSGGGVGVTSGHSKIIPYVSGSEISVPYGRAAQTTVGSSYLYETGATALTGTAYSLFAAGNITNLSALQNSIDDDAPGSRALQFRIWTKKVQLITFDTLGNPYFATTSDLTDDQMASGFTMGASVEGNNLVAFKNLEKASGTASNTQRVPTGNMRIGGDKGGGGTGWVSGGLSLVAGWNRALSDAEQRSLACNPWQLFRAQPIILSSVASSAYIGTATGTSTATGISGKVATSTGTASVTGVSGSIATATGSAVANAISGSIASASGASNVAALSGAVAVASGASSSVAIAGSVAVSSGAATVQGVAGSLGSASGSSTVQGFAFAGGTGTATGGSVVQGVAGHIGQASGSSTAAAYAEGGSTGVSIGSSTAQAVSGAVGQASGASTGLAIRGFIASASGSSTASAVSISLYLAQATGSANVLAVAGRVGIAIGTSSATAVPLPTGIRPIEPTYNPLPIDFAYTTTDIDSGYNVLTIESGYYGNPT